MKTVYQDISKSLRLEYKNGFLVDSIWTSGFSQNLSSKTISKLQLAIEDKEENLDLVIFKKVEETPKPTTTNWSMKNMSAVRRAEIQGKIITGIVLVTITIGISYVIFRLFTQNCI